MEITPELAELFLEDNYEANRKVRKGWVDQLADMMRKGTFVSENGQTIVFGEDGKLYDGQHRLMAIVESGCPQKLFVVWVEDGERTYQTIDNGNKRNAGDFVGRGVASYSAIMSCVEYGTGQLAASLEGRMMNSGSNKRRTNRIEVVDYAHSHLWDAERNVAQGVRMRKVLMYGAESLYAAFVGIVRFVKRDDYLDSFVYDYCQPSSQSATINALKGLIARKKGTGSLNKTWFVGVLLDAYEHYRAFDGVTMLNASSKRIALYSRLVDEQRNRQRQNGMKNENRNE